MAQRRLGESVASMWERCWRERLEAWRRSGLTQAEFCQAEGIPASSLSRWKGRLQRGQASRPEARRLRGRPAGAGVSSQQEEVVRWAEVRLAGEAVPAVAARPSVSSGGELELVLPGGWSIRLGPGFEAAALRRLLGVLGGGPC